MTATHEPPSGVATWGKATDRRRAPDDASLHARLVALTLEQKVLLLTGQHIWTTQPIHSIGLRRMLVSDGPSGVRGEVWDERDPSLNLPSATALSASWDPELARRFGAAAAVEARRKDVDVILGPTINLHRSPLGGRHFECFSEDPVLTGNLAAAYVTGVQANGVGACPKHYVANDFETERFTVDVKVDDRALRELYLLAFEKAVSEARAWMVMSAYNAINGAAATENVLLQTPLKDEWGFDGVVVSDWTAVRTLESAAAEQDLVMPGPHGPWGTALVDAVRRGEIDEKAIDRKVVRILRLAQRVGALDGLPRPEPVLVEPPIPLVRHLAAEGMVLLENSHELPWDGRTLRRIAVIGENAASARTQGGGSATVLPAYTVSPLEGLRAALPTVDVTYSTGASTRSGIVELPLSTLTNPVTSSPGVRTRFLDARGEELYVEDRRTSNLMYLGGDAPIGEADTFELHARFTPRQSGLVRLGFALAGLGRLYVDGRAFIDTELALEGTNLGVGLLNPPTTFAEVELVAGTPVDLRLVYRLAGRQGLGAQAMSVCLGTEPTAVDDDVLLDEAVRAAAEADVALVVVGTNALVESEGHDRASLALPGRQDDLVRAVVAANPRTVVVVNAGAPVLLPWRHDVAALLIGWFGGQEFGNALADVLLGIAEPGGRLPTTWPAAEEDVPVLSCTPHQGVMRYDEGIHVGYRAWLRAESEPAYWFGSGLGYTTFELTGVSSPTTAGPGDVVRLRVAVANRGERDGKDVVQVYAEKPDSQVERPVRWLVGSAPVRVAAGTTVDVDVEIPTRYLAHWAEGWTYEPGNYRLRVGRSAVDLPLETEIVLSG